jgi:hypothetical protein
MSAPLAKRIFGFWAQALFWPLLLCAAMAPKAVPWRWISVRQMESELGVHDARRAIDALAEEGRRREAKVARRRLQRLLGLIRDAQMVCDYFTNATALSYKMLHGMVPNVPACHCTWAFCPGLSVFWDPAPFFYMGILAGSKWTLCPWAFSLLGPRMRFASCICLLKWSTDEREYRVDLNRLRRGFVHPENDDI